MARDMGVHELFTAADAEVTGCLGGLRRYVSHRLVGRGITHIDADDVVQEAILRAWRHRDQARFENAQAIVGYLRCIADHHVIDLVRRDARRPVTTPVDERVPARGPSPVTALLARERRRQLEKALLQIRPPLRRAIVRQLRGDRDLRAFATDLGSPSPDAARVALARGRQAVARAVARADAGSGRHAAARGA